MSTLQDYSISGIQSDANLTADLEGLVVLAVNVASRCGLTPQYEGLQDLQDEFEDQNFTVRVNLHVLQGLVTTALLVRQHGIRPDQSLLLNCC